MSDQNEDINDNDYEDCKMVTSNKIFKNYQSEKFLIEN